MASLPSRDEQLPSVHHQDSQNTKAAKHFFAKALAVPHISTPRVITVDKNAAYPKAFKELKAVRIIVLATCAMSRTMRLPTQSARI